MQRAHWLRNAWTGYQSQASGVYADNPHWLTVFDEDNNVCGTSAWFKQFSRGINWWRLVGSGPICSDYVTLSSRSDCEREVAQATARWFALQPRKFLEAPIAIEVEGHRDDSQAWSAFFEALVVRGWTQDTVNIESAWRLELPSDWHTYELQLSKSRRRKVRRAIKLSDQGELTFTIVSDRVQLENLWPEFVRLHQLRRSQLGQAGVFADSNFERFLRSAMLDFATEGSSYLACVNHQEIPLGIVLVFQSNATWFIYQSGFDTTRSDLEPGHMVNSLMLREAMNRGIREVDFLRGDEHYKSGWKAKNNTLCRTILLPPGLASRGISSALKLRRNVKAWLNQSVGDSKPSQQISEEEL